MINDKILGHPFTKNLIGKKFGKLTVESFAGTINCGIKKLATWNCICECGGKKTTRAGSLVQGLTKSCGCLNSRCNIKNHKWTGYEEISGSYFGAIKIGAEARNLEFEITIEQIWDLFLKQNRKCALSGVELNFRTKHIKSDGTASLDRINSNLGYLINNIQWIHKDVNFMKQEYQNQDYIDWCAKITDYQRSLISKSL